MQQILKSERQDAPFRCQWHKFHALYLFYIFNNVLLQATQIIAHYLATFIRFAKILQPLLFACNKVAAAVYQFIHFWLLLF